MRTYIFTADTLMGYLPRWRGIEVGEEEEALFEAIANKHLGPNAQVRVVDEGELPLYDAPGPSPEDHDDDADALTDAFDEWREEIGQRLLAGEYD